MKFFIAFLIICFVGGLIMWDSPPRRRTWVLLTIVLALIFAYFFLNKI